MPHEQNPTRSKLVGLVGFCVVLALLIAGGLWWFNRDGDALAGEKLNAFPTVDYSELTSAQSQLVTSLEQEWESGDPGTKYAEGVEESWCADFVSWNMNQIGAPFSNPKSSSWRIPGVYTLQEYYESVGSFVPYGQDYQPKVGDTILYSGDSPFGQHVNIVLVNDAGTLTTIGGNENNSVMIHRIDPSEVAGIVGFGAF
ncbi:CHAP domain-containing protein [Rhodococcus sp. IEGM 1379]|uniref:CHAP domain-containing protein n=1 Tax=Rhodococcus sp. IEGM 1379 TaxID=3047086 RepID=UPI0024B6D4AE|nr:CHAP domain-containing protein [Rhodococcus sp. IEGM 1379]MDI9915822.1 CHAP domain-containing protein [Rhodococcus sp. IEGM 1379]